MLFLALCAGFTGLQKGVLGGLLSRKAWVSHVLFAVRSRVCIIFTMGRFRAIGWISFYTLFCFVFHASILIFSLCSLSFICVRFLFFSFFFEDFSLANLKNDTRFDMPGLRNSRVTSLSIFWSIYLVLIIYSNVSFLLFSFLVVKRDGVLINVQGAVGLPYKLFLCSTLYDHQ